MCGAAAWALSASMLSHFSTTTKLSGPYLVWMGSAGSASTAAPYSMQPFSALTAGTLARKCVRMASRWPGLAVMTAMTWIISFSPSVEFLELLQRTHALRDRRVRERGREIGVAHLAHVDVAAGVDRDAMRRDEFPRLQSGPGLAAEPRDGGALAVHDRQTRADIGHIAVHFHAGPQFPDDELQRLLASAAVQAAGPVHVDPLCLVLAVAVEYLHPMVLAVGDVDPALRVGDDVVDDVELARIGARLAPGQQALA